MMNARLQTVLAAVGVAALLIAVAAPWAERS